MPTLKLSSLLLTTILLTTANQIVFSQGNLHRVPDATDSNATSKLQKDRASDPQPNQRVRGEVLFPDRNPPPSLVELYAVCPTFSRWMAIAGSNGKFSFSFDQARLSDLDLTGNCVLNAVLEGYRSQPTSLAGLTTKTGRNLGTIILTPVSADPKGLTSLWDAQASAEQKKHYQEAIGKASHQDWKAATKILQDLTSAYPQYTSAWLNLAICQQMEGHLQEAEASYLNAIRVDPKFARPFIRAAALETLAGNLQAALIHSQSAIDLNATAFPEAYSLNAVANLSLQHADAAEKSARAGVALDPDHRFPELDYILGTVLCSRNERTAAREYLQRYIAEAPNGPNLSAAKNQLEHIPEASEQSAVADVEHFGPAESTFQTGQPASTRSVQDKNRPLLENPSAYTCLESILPSKSDVPERVHRLKTIRVDIGVSDGREIYGPADGKQFSDSAQTELLGGAFNTTGLFSSIAHVVVAGSQLVINPVGQFSWHGQSVFRYDFHSQPATAGWKLAYGNQSGNAAEAGWFLVDVRSLTLRSIFVTAKNIPDNLKLMSLSAWIDYEPETLAGRRVLLPVSAKVDVAELSGLRRVSLISFDHCRTFTTDSTVSFVETNPHTNSRKDGTINQTRLPISVEVIASLNSPLSLTTASDNDILTASVVQPIVRNSRELIAKGATIEGHIRVKRGEDAVIIQFDRVQTSSGWAPFYAQLLSLSATGEARIERPDQQVPGVAAIAFATKSAELPAGTLTVWRTEPLTTDE